MKESNIQLIIHLYLSIKELGVLRLLIQTQSICEHNYCNEALSNQCGTYLSSYKALLIFEMVHNVVCLSIHLTSCI